MGLGVGLGSSCVYSKNFIDQVSLQPLDSRQELLLMDSRPLLASFPTLTALGGFPMGHGAVRRHGWSPPLVVQLLLAPSGQRPGWLLTISQAQHGDSHLKTKKNVAPNVNDIPG